MLSRSRVAGNASEQRVVLTVDAAVGASREVAVKPMLCAFDTGVLVVMRLWDIMAERTESRCGDFYEQRALAFASGA
jgi:hypothetical protein